METKNEQQCKILYFKPKRYQAPLVDIGLSLHGDLTLSTSISTNSISPMLSVIISDNSTISTEISGNRVDLRSILREAARIHEGINQELADAFTELLDKINKDDGHE